MNLLNFLPGFIGTLIGLIVYQLLIRPLAINLYVRLKSRREEHRVEKDEHEYQKGREFAWSAWGTRKLSFNTLTGGGFSSTTVFGRGMDQALKESGH